MDKATQERLEEFAENADGALREFGKEYAGFHHQLTPFQEMQISLQIAHVNHAAAQTLLLSEVQKLLNGAFGFGYDVGLTLDRIHTVLHHPETRGR